MPIIHVTLFEGRTPEQKREFAEVITRETSRILKSEPASVDIIFTDVKKSEWSTGGKLWSDQK